MVKSRVLFVAISLLAVASVGLDAQDMFFRRALPPPPGDAAFVAADPVEQVGVIAIDPINVGRTVENAPYTAEAITEVTQVLADGNRIEQRASATIARDSRGRTRREQQGIALGSFVAQNPQPIVTITDPTTGVHVTLNYDRKIAFRAKPMQVKMERAQGSGAVVTYGASVAVDARAAGPGQDFTVAVPAPPAGAPFDGPVWETRARVAEWRGEAVGVPVERAFKNEKLEPRTIEGLNAEGTKSTVTIPAGAMGNTLPIEIVSEQWYSPELGVVLLTRRADPRFGETVYRLTNINRSEPSSELFKVPADFKVQDMGPGRLMPVKPNEER